MRSVPIIFWSIEDRPSLHMRGRQVAEELGRRGYRTEVRWGSRFHSLSDVRDSIVIAIKRQVNFPALKLRRNVTIFDAVDYEPTFGPPPVGADAVVTCTEYVADMIRRHPLHPRITRTIYHHADPGLLPHRAGESRLSLVYVGEPGNSAFLDGSIPQLHIQSFRTPNWREEVRAYNAHFSARIDPMKAAVKLANVAVLRATFLTGREPGCLELLGPDYPFYLRDHTRLDLVRDDVDRLEQSVGGTLWNEARDRIDAAAKHLTLAATADAYEKLFEELLDRREPPTVWDRFGLRPRTTR